jgi:hypothetical protein
MEVLIEELMDLHASSLTFRQIFQSQQTTQLFIDGYKSFVCKLALSSHNLRQSTIRILEKLSHFGLTLALDNVVISSQKRDVSRCMRLVCAHLTSWLTILQILDVVQLTQTVLNPSLETPTIDPTLIGDARSARQRIASARISMHLGEKTTFKSITRIQEWRKTVITSERKRLRKTVLDL